MGYALKTRKSQKRIDREVLIQTRAPLATDDYSKEKVDIGTLWVDSVAGAVYVCKDPSIGAAVWTAVGDGASKVTTPTSFNTSTATDIEGVDLTWGTVDENATYIRVERSTVNTISNFTEVVTLNRTETSIVIHQQKILQLIIIG